VYRLTSVKSSIYPTRPYALSANRKLPILAPDFSLVFDTVSFIIFLGFDTLIGRLKSLSTLDPFTKPVPPETLKFKKSSSVSVFIDRSNSPVGLLSIKLPV
jgi:hypothetical protein